MKVLNVSLVSISHEDDNLLPTVSVTRNLIPNAIFVSNAGFPLQKTLYYVRLLLSHKRTVYIAFWCNKLITQIDILIYSHYLGA